MSILEARGLSPAAARTRATALQLDDRPLGNPRETYGDFMLPGLGLLILHQLCLVGSAFASAASPGAHRLKDFAARISLFTLWYGFWCAIWIGIVLPAMDVPVSPQLVPLFALCLLGLVASSLLGGFVGMLIGEPGAAAQLLAFSSYPFFFASGASWPREMFPAAVEALGKIVPLGPWITAANRAMRMGAGLADVAPELLQLCALATGWSLVLWASCLWIARHAPNHPSHPSRQDLS